MRIRSLIVVLLFLFFSVSNGFASSTSGIRITINNFELKMDIKDFTEDFRIGDYRKILWIIQQNYAELLMVKSYNKIYLSSKNIEISIDGIITNKTINSTQEGIDIIYDFILKKHSLKENKPDDTMYLFGLGFFLREDSKMPDIGNEIFFGAFPSTMIIKLYNCDFIFMFYFDKSKREKMMKKIPESNYLVYNLLIKEDTVISLY